MTCVWLHKKLSRCFQEWLYHFAFQESIKVPLTLHPHQHLELLKNKNKPFLIGVKEYLLVALLIMLSIFSHAYLKNMYFLWFSVCTNICPFWLIFYWWVVETSLNIVCTFRYMTCKYFLCLWLVFLFSNHLL